MRRPIRRSRAAPDATPCSTRPSPPAGPSRQGELLLCGALNPALGEPDHRAWLASASTCPVSHRAHRGAMKNGPLRVRNRAALPPAEGALVSLRLRANRGACCRYYPRHSRDSGILVTTVPAEDDRVIGPGGGATERESCRGGAGRATLQLSSGLLQVVPLVGVEAVHKDPMRQIVGAVGGRDVIADHAPLAGRRDPAATLNGPVSCVGDLQGTPAVGSRR